MKRLANLSIITLSMIFIISCTSDNNTNSNDGNNTDRSQSNFYLPQIGEINYFEDYELDENDSPIGNPTLSEQLAIGYKTLEGFQTLMFENLNKETNLKDTMYLREDSDFLYMYFDSDDIFGGDAEGQTGMIPEFEFEPQWVKISSFTQFNWKALEVNLPEQEVEFPFGGQTINVKLKIDMLWDGEKTQGELFTIKDKNESIETVKNIININIKIDLIVPNLPIKIPGFPRENKSKLIHNISKGFGIVQTFQPTQKQDPNDEFSIPIPGNLSKLVDYD